jgi:Rrf2 family nitric oxide-sensitive transcriptional repressor
MRLTTFSDYTLRVLMYLALDADRRATIPEIARAYGISENHLMKVVHQLGRAGVIESVRGKGGGLRLARAPETLRIGDIVRASEGSGPIVECLADEPRWCCIAPACKRQGALVEAVEAMYDHLNRYTLADLVEDPKPQLIALTTLSRGSLQPAASAAPRTRGSTTRADARTRPSSLRVRDRS